MVNARAVAIALCSVLLVSCAGGNSGPAIPHAPGSQPPPASMSPVQHVIVVIQENRTTDNLFNGFPNANTVTSGLDSNGNTVPLTPVSLSGQFDPDHQHSSLATEYDNGKMDGFDKDTCDFNPLGGGDCTSFFGPPANFTYAYVPGPGVLTDPNTSDTIQYWLLAGWVAPAEGYGFADEMFSTRQVPSFPGHQFLIAGTGPADDPTCVQGSTTCKASKGLTQGIWGCDAPPGTVAGQLDWTNYTAPEVFTNAPCYDYQALGDLMNKAGVTWKYYTGVVGSLDGLISAYDAIKHIRYSASWNKNISTPMTNILNDIQNNTLPQVSFVTPPGPASDHAGFLSAGGPGWVGEIYLFLAQNPTLYANTAVLVTWDDSGGWYDHVAPPCYDNRVLPAPSSCDANGPLGFRVPLIVISPYAIQAVNHDVHSYGSILHFIEKNWNMGTLGSDDAMADDLSDMFNYNQTPIQPLVAKDPRFTAAMKRYSRSYFERLRGTHPVDDE